jgi:hypothetical protein
METLGIFERPIPKNLGELAISFFCFYKHLAAYAYYKTRKNKGIIERQLVTCAGSP